MPEKPAQIKEFLAPAPLWEDMLLTTKEKVSPRDQLVIDEYRAVHSFLFGIGDTRTKYAGILEEAIGRRPDEQTHFQINREDWIAYAERPTTQDLRDFFNLRWRALLRVEKTLRNSNEGKPNPMQQRVREEIDRTKLAEKAFVREDGSAEKHSLSTEDPRFQAAFSIFKDEADYVLKSASNLALKQKFSISSFITKFIPRLTRGLSKTLREEQTTEYQELACSRTLMTMLSTLLPADEYATVLRKYVTEVLGIDYEQANPQINITDHSRFAPEERVINRENWTKQFLNQQKD